MHILIIDDDEDSRDLLCGLVQDAGFECQDVGSAAEGLEVIEATSPNIILIDIYMPDIDGCQLARMLEDHPRRKAMTLVAVTGFSGEPIVYEVVAAGFDAFMSKPVDLDALEGLFRSLSEQKGGAPRTPPRRTLPTQDPA
jgi:CheY-like chemotaxis protein